MKPMKHETCIVIEYTVYSLGGGFKYFLFSSLLGEDSHFDQYFPMKNNTSCGDSTIQPYLSIRPRLPAQTYLPLVRCSMPKVRWLIKRFQEVDIEIPRLKLVENLWLFQALKRKLLMSMGFISHFWGGPCI